MGILDAKKKIMVISVIDSPGQETINSESIIKTSGGIPAKVGHEQTCIDVLTRKLHQGIVTRKV